MMRRAWQGMRRSGSVRHIAAVSRAG